MCRKGRCQGLCDRKVRCGARTCAPPVTMPLTLTVAGEPTSLAESVPDRDPVAIGDPPSDIRIGVQIRSAA